jgi:branched-subunit amino acid aminotransferase/4-amino-4-deoxychorismate lyase
MANYLLKKSYRRKNLKEIKFRDLWNDHGVFTTMWIYGKPPRILFFKSHIDNLIKSLKVYKIYESNIKSQILKLINLNIKKNKNYNHLLRVAVKKNIISISIRNKIKTQKNFNLNIINYKRIKPEYKNLKYKIILKHLSKLDPSKSDIALVVNNKILESGTSNLLFVSKNKIYSPVNNFYKGTNIRFLEKKFKIIKKDIFLKNINKFEEIILVGSGKGITSVKQINEINWNKKSDKFYKKLLFIYNREIKIQKSIYKYI